VRDVARRGLEEESEEAGHAHRQLRVRVVCCDVWWERSRVSGEEREEDGEDGEGTGGRFYMAPDKIIQTLADHSLHINTYNPTLPGPSASHQAFAGTWYRVPSHASITRVIHLYAHSKPLDACLSVTPPPPPTHTPGNIRSNAAAVRRDTNRMGSRLLEVEEGQE
jgi:hypothetical protein